MKSILPRRDGAKKLTKYWDFVYLSVWFLYTEILVRATSCFTAVLAIRYHDHLAKHCLGRRIHRFEMNGVCSGYKLAMNQRRGGAINTGRTHTGRKLRLVLEPLEARRLLAGINVSVFLDQNGTRGYEELSDGLAQDRLVYVDLNLNGQYDAEEPLEVTDERGEAFFEDLDAGEYSVGIITNPLAQPQVSPTRVDSAASQISNDGGEVVVADSDFTHVWVINDRGDPHRIVGGDTSSDLQSLDGQLVSLADIDEYLVLGVVASGGESRIIEFDTRTGSHSELTVQGLSEGEQVTAVTRSGDDIVALVGSDEGESSIATVVIGNAELDLVRQTEMSLSLIAGNQSSAGLLVVGPETNGSSRLSILGSADAYSQIASLDIDGAVEGLELSPDGALAFVSIAGGGVHAVAVAPDALTLVAILSEATSPVNAGASDGKIVTASNDDEGELIVWDPASWLPVARTQTPAGTRVAGRAQLETDRRGDRLVVAHADGVHQIDLSIATTQRVHVDGKGVQEAVFGIRSIRENTPPTVDIPPVFSLREDTRAELSLSEEASFGDPDGDSLWFTLATPANHGVVDLLPTGKWRYLPNENFTGLDSAVLRILDGQAATEVTVQIDVQPVNDPPISISVDVPVISESTAIGDQLGFVSIVDVDSDAGYRVTTSDSRFVVENGRLFLASGGLDFESESSISLQVVGVDLSDPAISIETQATIFVGDDNEPPVALRLSSSSVLENEPGAEIGELIVEDQDTSTSYEFSVSDQRFTIVGGKLRLNEDDALDHEQEAEISITVEARDTTNSEHVVSETLRLTVLNANEAPQGISFSSQELEANLPGANVGTVAVHDPDNERYVFVVSDPRFEVQGSTLKLRDDEAIDRDQEPIVNVTVEARGASGDRISTDLAVRVTPARSPYQNRDNPNDVNGDGIVSPLDALILINYLNSQGGFDLEPPSGTGGNGENGPANFPDVNGDNMLSPIDVLMIINFLNSTRDPGGGAEGEAFAQHGSTNEAAPVYGPQLRGDHSLSSMVSYSDIEQRKRDASRIDAELETLLDQLSRERTVRE